jgi:tetratricopeptide (TPR) repeat protein
MAVLAGHCIEQDAVVPYLPFVEVLEACVDRSTSLDRLRSLLGEDGPDLARLLPKLRRVLPDLPAPLELPPEQARHHLFNCFHDFVARLAREQPMLLILDDLHWADESSLSLLSHLARRLSNLPLLLVGTYRDVEASVGRGLARTLEELLRGRLATPIKLKGLPRDEVAQMLKELSGQTPPAAVAEEIYRETEGNPFFVEELFRYLEEENRLYDAAGSFPEELKIAELEVPQSVRLVVGRRLARLGERTREMLATAAVSGRSFTFQVLEASGGADGLVEAVEEAEKAGLILTAAEGVRAEFCHELIRQAVLSDLSALRRQRFHLELAGAIERIYAGRLENHCAELAHHYSLGGNLSKAVEYLEQAALRAAQQLAYSEAVAFASSAIEKLRSLPEGDQRDRVELRLQPSMSFYLMLSKGYATVEAAAPLRRTRELAAKLQAWPEFFFATALARGFHSVRRELSQSRKLAEELAAMADHSGDPRALAAAAHALGEEAAVVGDFVTARRHLERARGLLSDQEKRVPTSAHSYWWDTFWLCVSLYNLGYLHQAQQTSAAAMLEAKSLGDQLGITVSAMTDSLTHLRGGNFPRALKHVELALSIAAEHGLLHITRLAGAVHAEAMINLGRFEEAIAEMRRLRADLDQENTVALQLNSFILLGLACGLGHHAEEGLRNLTRALEVIEATGERWAEPLVHSMLGRILLMGGDLRAEEAERHLRTAIDLARRQQGKLCELNSTAALARLIARRGDRVAARTMLSEVYAWFTEGFDSPSLKEAKSLLDELNG